MSVPTRTPACHPRLGPGSVPDVGAAPCMRSIHARASATLANTSVRSPLRPHVGVDRVEPRVAIEEAPAEWSRQHAILGLACLSRRHHSHKRTGDYRFEPGTASWPAETKGPKLPPNNLTYLLRPRPADFDPRKPGGEDSKRVQNRKHRSQPCDDSAS
jgi:hypothetical protein